MKKAMKNVLSILLVAMMVFGIAPLNEMFDLDISLSDGLFVQKAEASSTAFLEPYKIVLKWGSTPRDLDSHLTGTLSNGSGFHCYFSNKKIYDGSTLIADLDVDDTNGYGPEVITISPSGLNGSYTYYIYNYTGSGTFEGAGATVDLYYGDKLVQSVSVPSGSGSGRYWSLFKFVDGKVHLINTVGTSVSSSSGELINNPAINEVYNEIERIVECDFSVKVVDGDGNPVRGAEVSVYLGKDRIGYDDSDSDGMVYFKIEDLNTTKDLEYLKKKATVSAHLSVGNDMELCSETVTSNGVWEGTLIKEIIDNGQALECDEPRWSISINVGYTAQNEKERKKRYNKVKSVLESFAEKFPEMTNGHVLVEDVNISSHVSDISLVEGTYDVYVMDDPSNVNLTVKTASTWGYMLDGNDYGGQYDGFIIFDYGNGYFNANTLCHEAGHLIFGMLDEYCYGKKYYTDTNGDGEICCWDCTCQDTTGDDVVDHEDRKNSGNWGETYSRPKLNGVSAPGNFGVMDSSYWGNIELSTDKEYKYLDGVSFDENHPEWYTHQYYIKKESTEKTLADFLENRISGYSVDYTYIHGTKQKAKYSYAKISIPSYEGSDASSVETEYKVLDGIDFVQSNINDLDFSVSNQEVKVSHTGLNVVRMYVETHDRFMEVPSFNGEAIFDVPEDFARLIFIHNIDGKEYKEIVNIVNDKYILYALIDCEYENEDFYSVENTLYVIENRSQGYTFEKALTAENDFNFEETFWFEVDENGDFFQLNTLIHYGENMEVFYSTEITGVGQYVLMSKDAVELSESSINNFLVSNDPDGDGIINISFDDSSEQTLYYELYYSNTPISDVSIQNDNVNLVVFKGCSLSIHVEPGVYYFVLKTRSANGSFVSYYNLPFFEYKLNDSNNDGIPDLWIDEYPSISDLEDVAGADSDDDGLTNLQEYNWGTNPINPDTDGDNVYDSVELWYDLDPLETMTDGATDDYVIVYSNPDVIVDGNSFVVNGDTVTCTISNNSEGKAMRTLISLYSSEGERLELSTVNLDSNSSVDYTFSRDYLEEGMRIVVDEQQITRDSDYSNNEFVYVPASNIIASNPEITMSKNTTVQLEYALTPEGASRIVEWESADESIVSVNNRGLVSAVKIGKATITVKTISGYTGTYAILVEPFPGAGETDFDCKLKNLNNNTEVEIIGYHGDDTDIVIPAYIGGYAVTSIATSSITKDGIKSISIPDTLVTIHDDAFQCYSSLETINVDSENKVFSSLDGVLFNVTKTKLILYPSARNDSEYKVPDTVYGISSSAFYKAANLKSIQLNNVTEIGSFAFDESGLTSVIIPEQVTVIDYGAFFNCEYLTTVYYNAINADYSTMLKMGVFSAAVTKVVLGSNVQVVRGSFFKNISAAEINIPESVNEIDLLPDCIKDIYYAGSARTWSQIAIGDLGESVAVHFGKFTATFIKEGEVISQTDYLPGEKIIPPEDPELKYYDFAGWSPEVPEMMPETDSEFTAMWTLSDTTRTVEYYADGVLYWYDYRCKGEKVTSPEMVPTKVGYTFADWSPEITETMPDENLRYDATWTINSHQVVFMADGIEHYSYECTYGDPIVPSEENPIKEGYAFAGWSDVPNSMPDNDVVINALFDPIVYTATFVDGETVLGTDEFTVEDTKLDCPAVEERAGYRWVWDEYDIVAGDITVGGAYELNFYLVTFIADGKVVGEQRFTMIDTEIINPDIPHKDGYTSAWEDYEVQLADFTVNAIYTPKTYTAIFTENGNIIGTDEFTIEDTALDYPEIVAKDHYNWQWDEHEIIADNLTINGAYIPIKYKAIFVADDVTVAIVEFDVENRTIINPDVPEKEGYTGEWPSYNVSLSDFKVVAQYYLITYTATFTYNGEVIGMDYFTINSSSLEYPETGYRQHYDWVWEEHEIIADNITINGGYVPTTYTIKFVSNGRIVKTQSYNVETTDSITAPALSLRAKTGYHSEWEKRGSRIGNLTINEIYVPNNYAARFWSEGKLVRTSTFTVENQKSDFTMPSLSERSGYKVIWSDFDIVANDIDVYAEYVPITYTATFVADGKILSTQNFTVESNGLNVPELPQKAGYIASWSYYTISAGDMVITARYYLPDVNLVSRQTLTSGDTYRLMPICNFTPTGKTWTSSDTSVATVDNTGVVTAVGDGKCTITLTCYGKDSLGNEIQATTDTRIIVNGEKDNSAKTFREMFDEFFEVALHDILYNFKAFLIVLFKYAY